MNDDNTVTQILVNRSDLSETRVAHPEAPGLDDGEIRLGVERFGFSANNITYATLGDDMGYWRFFPAENGWGLVPVWGHAVVTESRCPEVPVGARYFGYYPLATQLVARPVKVSDSGFMDGSAHRAALPPVYQRYTRAADAESADIAYEDQDALWRPLFVTAFGAADYLIDNDDFGAATLVLTSASSKTAMGIAFCMKRLDAGVEVVGLTSPANKSFCEKTGYYDRVLEYDSLSDLGNGPIVLVDLAGDDALIDRIADHATDNLLKTVVLGATHWQDRERSLSSPRPGSELFFLPAWVIKRRDDWGPTEFFERSDAAWQAFQPTTESWMAMDERIGSKQIAEVYGAALRGELAPDHGYALSFG